LKLAAEEEELTQLKAELTGLMGKLASKEAKFDAAEMELEADTEAQSDGSYLSFLRSRALATQNGITAIRNGSRVLATQNGSTAIRNGIAATRNGITSLGKQIKASSAEESGEIQFRLY
jgi:hypothetical protein